MTQQQSKNNNIKRILFVSMEFATGTIFSGNGVLCHTYAREIVKSYSDNSSSSKKVQLDVLCAYPFSEEQENTTNNNNIISGWIDEIQDTSSSSCSPLFIGIPVPPEKWRKLDVNGPYQEFSDGCVEKLFEGENNNNDSSSSSLSQLANIFQQKRTQKKEDQEDENSTTTTTKTNEKSSSSSSYDLICLVDWHGFICFDKICPISNLSQTEKDKIIFLNFRVFANRFLLDENNHKKEFEFYRNLEKKSVMETKLTLVLSEVDKLLLVEHFSTTKNTQEKENSSSSQQTKEKSIQEIEEIKNKIDILVPPLQPAFFAKREQFFSSSSSSPLSPSVAASTPIINNSSSSSSSFATTVPHSYCNNNTQSKNNDNDPRYGKFFFSSCLRLDKTKNVQAFVDIVRILAEKNNNNKSDDDYCFSLVRSKTFPNASVIPFLCGAAADQDYARKVRTGLREICSQQNKKKKEKNEEEQTFVIREDFVSSKELEQYFHSSILNLHPTFYEAYGMTIAEAACCGCLTVTHGEQNINNNNNSSASSCSSSLDVFANKIRNKNNNNNNNNNIEENFETQKNHEKFTSPVGATGLLDFSNGEIILLDFNKLSVEELSNEIENILEQLLDLAVETNLKNQNNNNFVSENEISSSNETENNNNNIFELCIQNAQTKSLSYGPDRAIERLFKLSSFC